jgi:hypothetical protein
MLQSSCADNFYLHERLQCRTLDVTMVRDEGNLKELADARPRGWDRVPVTQAKGQYDRLPVRPHRTYDAACQRRYGRPPPTRLQP